MSQRPALYVAITNHGFGHAVRAASVAAAVQKLNPEILLILVTTAPRWLLESYIPGDFILRPRAFDVGVIQSDSLNMDRPATLEKLREIRKRQNSIIAGEVNFLHLNRVGLVLADIPPLAAPIAKAAGIPCWMMSNFGWDFIYREWGGEFAEMADWISECFSKCDLLFRLPMHEPMGAFPNITDVGLTGGSPRYSDEELKASWGITAPREKTVLLTFGGLGVDGIPYHNLSQFTDWQFITFDRQAPDFPNLIKVAPKQQHPLRPVDFMPVCGRVVSKPGYSTFSEALRLDVPVVSLTREGFAESPLLMEGIQDFVDHQIVSPAEFFEGSWKFLRQPLQPPANPSRWRKMELRRLPVLLLDISNKGFGSAPAKFDGALSNGYIVALKEVLSEQSNAHSRWRDGDSDFSLQATVDFHRFDKGNRESGNCYIDNSYLGSALKLQSQCLRRWHRDRGAARTCIEKHFKFAPAIKRDFNFTLSTVITAQNHSTKSDKNYAISGTSERLRWNSS